ncbi:restriction endonuclease [Candidatus Lokiarchaeum ossiferum]
MDNIISLNELTRTFFSRKYEYIVPEEPIRGRSGHKWSFDGMINYKGSGDESLKIGVFVREWNRSVGVNQVRQLEKACRDTKCDGGIIVADIFSSNAEIFAENLGITTVDRAKIMSKMQSGL